MNINSLLQGHQTLLRQWYKCNDHLLFCDHYIALTLLGTAGELLQSKIVMLFSLDIICMVYFQQGGETWMKQPAM